METSIRFDATLFQQASDDLSAALEGLLQTPDCRLDLLGRALGLRDIFRIHGESVTADGAGEIRMVLKPSERLLELVTALRAGDWQMVERIAGHEFSSDGGVSNPIGDASGSGVDVAPDPLATSRHLSR